MRHSIRASIRSAAFACGLAAAASSTAGAQTTTELLRSGPNGSKLNIVIIGDGFTAANQAAFNTFVDNMVIRGVFDELRDGVYREVMNAFNLFRINVNSAQSGITLVDSTGAVTTTVNTFLGYRFSGRWNRCWMEPGPNSNTILTNTLNAQVPGWTYAFIILNTASFGGCRRGNQLAVTVGGTWTVAAHEMGHMVGNLGDEYTGATNYTGGEPGVVNLTANSNRATLKWNQFVNPATAVPTPTPFGGSAFADAGVFAGATIGQTRFGTGIFRPSVNDRMNGNAPEFDPVCYDQMQRATQPQHEYRFRNVYAGHFTGPGHDDLMLHNANSIALYTGAWDQINPAWVRTLPDPVWDAYRGGDKFLVGDFDGDGRSDLFVYNFTDWSMPYLALLRSTGTGFQGVRRFDRNLPGWGAMTPNDEFHVADFDGDGRDDLVVFNGRDFSIGYLLMLRSTGNDLAFVRRFDDVLPGWGAMKANDLFYVADFDNDRRSDLYIFNGRDWAIGYLEMLRSTGTNYSFTRRFDQTLPGWGDMRRNDQFYVSDFDADGRKDLYIFNGPDWSMPYLEMLRSTGTNMSFTRRFDRTVPGWGEMRRNDIWFPADMDGNGRGDLYVYNSADWSTQYLGTLRSSGSNLGGGWQDDWIGSWNLGPNDKFRVANFNGGSGWDDLFVFNDQWFGLLKSGNGASSLSAIYRDWIHNHNYHNLGWW
jgi:IgA peptidase M64/VCBS repeat protein